MDLELNGCMWSGMDGYGLERMNMELKRRIWD